MKKLATAGLVLYCIIAGWGPFIEPGISSPAIFPWMIGCLFLVFLVSYETLFQPSPASARKHLPFRIVILGIIVLNFLVQVTGGIRSTLWPAYFLYGAIAAAFSPPGHAAAMVTVIICIESANLFIGGHDVSGRGLVYAGFGASLAGVSLASSYIMRHIRREAEQAWDAHDRLIAGSEAIDPLADTASKIESLTRDHRQKAHLKTSLQREATFHGLIDMIHGFIPAHTYALFLREQRNGRDVSVLRAMRTESDHAVVPIGTELDPNRDAIKTDVDVCAEHRQSVSSPDMSRREGALSKLGYYRKHVRDLPVRSFQMIPIVRDDRTIAVLAVDSLEPGAFSLDTVDMLEKFAPFFVQIIDKIDSAVRLKMRADHFGALHEISTELNSSMKFGEIIDKVIPRIQDVVPFDFCACVLLSEQENRALLTFTALLGYDRSFLGRSFPLEESAIARYMQKHWRDRGIIRYYTADFGNRGKDIGLFPFRELQRPVRSLYGRLLVAKDTLLGSFFLASTRPDAFTSYHRECLLDTLLNQISMVAYNSLLYQQIEGMARTDGLTGLLNRRTFTEKLTDKHRELDRMPRPFSVLLMDIDKFKAVNDRYGHPVGDQAIRAVARVLQDTIRGTDFVARYGGEEFAVGMLETDSAGAVLIAERVRKIMEQTAVARVFDGELNVTLSIGVASFPEETDTVAHLVTMADEALYHAKRSGRNRVCTHREAKNSPQPAAEA